jgi:hypothetical protein
MSAPLWRGLRSAMSPSRTANVWHSLQYPVLQQACCIVILSTLLVHYHHLDHPQFTKLGDLLAPGDRLLAERP